MTKKLICALICAALLLGFMGCKSQVLTENCVIELTGNATTGCAWEYTMSTEGVISEESSDYVQDTDFPLANGVGGKYIFTFAPVSVGDVTLHFIYRQPWEPDTVYAECDYTLHCDGERVTLVGEAPDPMAQE